MWRTLITQNQVDKNFVSNCRNRVLLRHNEVIAKFIFRIAYCANFLLVTSGPLAKLSQFFYGEVKMFEEKCGNIAFEFHIQRLAFTNSYAIFDLAFGTDCRPSVGPLC